MPNTFSRYKPRLPLQGEDLKRLPKALQQMTKGLKRPVVTVGYNSNMGQSVLGMRINDGNKPVSAIAVSFDTTHGAKPILQARYKMVTPDTGETALSGSMMFNPNSKSDDFIHAFSKRNGVHRLEHLEKGTYFSQTFNPIPASRHNLEMPTVQEFTEMSQGIGSQMKRLNEEYLKLVTHRKGKHKIGRYLYHLTSEKNYDKIVASGGLKPFKDNSDPLHSVCMFDMGNLTRRWRNSKDWDYQGNIAARLIGHTSQDGDQLVLLRIPTAQLEHSSLKIRSQNRAFKTISANKKITADMCDDAANASLYKKRKEAIEYLYPDNIPIENVELVGKADLTEIRKLTSSDGKDGRFVLATLKKLCSGQPEMKGLDKIT